MARGGRCPPMLTDASLRCPSTLTPPPSRTRLRATSSCSVRNPIQERRRTASGSAAAAHPHRDPSLSRRLSVPEGGPAMAYEVELKEIEAEPTLVIRVETTPNKLGETFAELLPEVSAYLASKGVEPAGPPFGR